MHSAQSEEDEDDHSISLANLRSLEDYYISLRPRIRMIHEQMTMEFDEKYGIYYRKHLQSMALNLEEVEEKYLSTLKENPEVAFIFWVETILL